MNYHMDMRVGNYGIWVDNDDNGIYLAISDNCDENVGLNLTPQEVEHLLLALAEAIRRHG